MAFSDDVNPTDRAVANSLPYTCPDLDQSAPDPDEASGAAGRNREWGGWERELAAAMLPMQDEIQLRQAALRALDPVRYETEHRLNPKDKDALAHKVQLSSFPSSAIIGGAQACQEGASNHGPYNWRTGPKLRYTVYLDALMRHLLALRDGENIDPYSAGELHHIKKILGGAAVLLDALECGQLEDDRPVYGPASRMLAPKP